MINKSREIGKCILEAAKIEAEKYINDAKNLVEKERRTAHGSGYLEGIKQGKTEALKEILNTNYKEITFLQNQKQKIIELATNIAEEIIGDTLVLQPESLLKRIERALSFTINANALSLFVHPHDFPRVKSSLSYLQQALPTAVPISLSEDETLKPQEARIDSNLGSITTKLDEHLEAIKLYLFKANE